MRFFLSKVEVDFTNFWGTDCLLLSLSIEFRSSGPMFGLLVNPAGFQPLFFTGYSDNFLILKAWIELGPNDVCVKESE